MEWGNWYALHDTSSGITGTNGLVYAIGMNAMTSNIYIGGSFTSPAAKIAMWNGQHWYNVGSGAALNGTVNAVDYVGSNLYIGGDFTNAGGSGRTTWRVYPAATAAGSRWAAA